MRGLLIATLIALTACTQAYPANAEEGLPNVLPEYRTPELRQHWLSFGTSTNPSRRYTHVDGQNPYRSELDLQDERSWRREADLRLNGHWGYSLDRPELRKSISFYFYYDVGRTSWELLEAGQEQSDDTDTSHDAIELNSSSGYRRYLASGLFAGLDLRFKVMRRVSTEDRDVILYFWGSGDDVVEMKGREKGDRLSDELELSLPLSLGWGRIHDVTNARLALYILDDLARLHCLTRSPSREEILDFSQLITHMNNERIFDSREKIIASIKALDDWLRQKDLLKTAGAEYFTSMYDNWENVVMWDRREHGSRISLTFHPTWQRFDSEYESILRLEDRELIDYEWRKGHGEERTLTAALEWNRSRALTKRHQLMLTAGSSFSYRSYLNNNSIFEFTDNPGQTVDEEQRHDTNGYAGSLYLSSSLEFHRDTRNSLGGSLIFQHNRSEFTYVTPTSNRDDERRSTNIRLRVSWSRAISMKNRLYVGLTQSWNRDKHLPIDNLTGTRLPHARQLYSRISLRISYYHTVF